MRCHSYDVIMEGNVILGGYCAGVPPLPIPNREVKPDCADGTAMQCGRVGGRLLFSDEDPADFSVGSFLLDKVNERILICFLRLSSCI